MKKTRILIVDDHPAMRHGLAQLIAKESDLEVCNEAGDRRETLAAIRRDSPDFVILDIGLKDPAGTGLDLIQEIHAHAGPVPILIYSMHDELVYAERALRSGARGYLMKQEPVREIIRAIRRILQTGVYVSEEINRRILLHHVGKSKKPRSRASSPQDCLTDREFEVFRLVGKGLHPREIAKRLHLSVKTVETHRMNIRKKLDLADASTLIRYAVEWINKTI